MDQDTVADSLRDSGFFDVETYRQNVLRANMPVPAPGDSVRHYIETGEARGLAPSLRFDPRFYLAHNPDLKDFAQPLLYHYVAGGRREGRIPTLADLILTKGLGPRVSALDCLPFVYTGDVEADQKNLQYLISRAATFDPREAFSGDIYLKLYPEVAQAKIDPLFHYLASGAREGRRSSVALFRKVKIDRSRYDPLKPVIVVGAHELSRTGAPLVAFNVALALNDRFNVVFMARRGGALEADIEGRFFASLISEGEDLVLAFAMDFLKPFRRPMGAIFSSVECDRLIETMADFDIPVLTLLHEYTEYTFPAAKTRVPLVLGEAVVYSSEHLKRSWLTLRQDLTAADERALVCAQPRTATGTAAPDREDARRTLGEALGQDLAGRRIVMGAGQAQMRKGTDLFLQIAVHLTRREPGKWLFVWIGELPQDDDVGYGIWLHILMHKQAVGNPDIRLLPPGPLYSTLQASAEAFLLTSRLDPLPNVVLDAMQAGQALFYFDDASGVRELVDNHPGHVSHASPYLDIFDMAERLAAHFTADLAGDAPGQTGDVVHDDYAGYAAWLVEVLETATQRTKAHMPDIPVDTDFVGELTTTAQVLKPAGNLAPDAARLTRLTLQSQARGISWIRPAHGVGAAGDPYPSRALSEVEGGLPARGVTVVAETERADLFDELLQRLVRMGVRDGVIAVTSEAAILDDLARVARQNAVGVTTRLIRHQEDGVFLSACAQAAARDPQALFGHFRLKQLDRSDAAAIARRDKAIDTLCTLAALRVFDDPAMGLVFPDAARAIGWGKDREAARTLLGDAFRSRPGPCPADGPIWARGDVVTAMQALMARAPGGHGDLAERLWTEACRRAGTGWTTVWLKE